MDVKLAVIGGTGIADQKLFRPVREVDKDTPYGKPSDRIRIMEFKGVNVAFLARHGAAHTIPPHMVNYRANINALCSLGVERIIGIAAVGSLKEDIRPCDMVIPDQFIDMTKQRKQTFYDGKKVIHISVADPFCRDMRELAVRKCRALGIPAHSKGTYLCVEGPRFSTRAESNLWRIMGADVVGMTIAPEAQLARELEMCYMSVCSVTDYDVWAEKPVSAREVGERMRENGIKVQNLLKELIPVIPTDRNCECKKALKDAGL